MPFVDWTLRQNNMVPICTKIPMTLFHLQIVSTLVNCFVILRMIQWRKYYNIANFDVFLCTINNKSELRWFDFLLLEWVVWFYVPLLCLSKNFLITNSTYVPNVVESSTAYCHVNILLEWKLCWHFVLLIGFAGYLLSGSSNLIWCVISVHS